jgi:hypothetical protein
MSTVYKTVACRASLFGALLAAACAAPSGPFFTVAVKGPLGPRDDAAARAVGVLVAASAPDRMEPETAAAGTQMAEWSRLRFLSARALARGRPGVFFELPALPEGREFADFPEEWQALARVAREISLARPVLSAAAPAALPFPLADGLEGRAWRGEGRRYLLLVNSGGRPAPLDERAAGEWRALFEVRSDPRELLVSCPGGRCLPPQGVLWLESRLDAGAE